jgi:hypothetical protein
MSTRSQALNRIRAGNLAAGVIGLLLLSACKATPPAGTSAPAAATSLSPSAATPLAASPRIFVDPARGSDSAAGTSAASAFKSLERARDAVRALPRPLGGNVTVILADGVYSLDKPFALTAADAGDNGFTVRYAAAPGATPRLDGGIRVTSWTLHDRAKGIYRATLPRPVESRQLFVNGFRALRARSVAGLDAVERVKTGYTLPSTSPIGTWKNPADLEFVYRHIWTNPRAGVASIAPRDGKLFVEMDQPGFDNGRNKGMTSIDKPWYVENAYELLDEPREWYLDRTGVVAGKPYTLFYKPADWENLRRAEVVIPALEQLITVEGASIDRPASGLAFEGLTFRYTTWLRPSSGYGLPDAQNNVMRENFAQLGKPHADFESIIDGAALRLRYARNIEISRCRFIGLGGMGVSFATAGAQDNVITGNSFYDIAATGLQIGEYLGWERPEHENAAFPLDPRLRATGNKITNNFMNRCAVEYRSGTAIGITFPRDTVIANNEIYNAPYIGIHLGWGWIRIPKSAMGGNVITANKVQNTMVELADGACIYTLGPSDPDHTPTVVRENYVRQTRWGHGLYFDERSSRYQVSDNLVLAAGDANVKFNGVDNREIAVTGLYSDKTRNIVSKTLDMEKLQLSIADVSPVTAAENAAAVARIKAGAGLQPAFAAARLLPLDAVSYELEEGELAGGPYATNGMGDKPVAFGYSGMGYISGFQGRPGALSTIKARLSSAGTYELRLRYSATAKPVDGLELAVNGTASPLPSLPATVEPNTWKTLKQRVTLRAGENSISIGSKSKDTPSVWLDRIDLVTLKQERHSWRQRPPLPSTSRALRSPSPHPMDRPSSGAALK